MRYALVSDVHGNLPALKAVLDDAGSCNVDEYIFVGDYFGDLPYTNEVVETIKKLEKSHIIKGNKENYLTSLSKSDQSQWIYQQFAPIYWNYRELTHENLEYLKNLPEDEIMSETYNYKSIHITHVLHSLIPSAKGLLSSFKFTQKMDEKQFSHDEYLAYAYELLSQNDNVIKELESIQSGMIIFGHSHIQWHAEINGKILINPGSCGLPLDFNRGAAYTILEYSGTRWNVIEKRISYDVESTIRYARNSDMYKHAKVWCDIAYEQLDTGRDIISFFLRHLGKVAKERDDNNNPYSNETWIEAVKSWNY